MNVYVLHITVAAPLACNQETQLWISDFMSSLWQMCEFPFFLTFLSLVYRKRWYSPYESTKLMKSHFGYSSCRYEKFLRKWRIITSIGVHFLYLLYHPIYHVYFQIYIIVSTHKSYIKTIFSYANIFISLIPIIISYAA